MQDRDLRAHGRPPAGGITLHVDVLGPIRVRDASGLEVTPPGDLQRRLLALLVLRRGHVVSLDAMIEALWPHRVPRDPVAAVHNHVFRLRRCLPDGVVESVGDGYRLDPTGVVVDADRLAAALAADDLDPADIAELEAIVDRWHGPAYPELEDVHGGLTEATRLANLRIAAFEARAGRRLAAGDTDGLVGEIAGLVELEPLRERPRSLLMAALAATGRRVEALRAYDDFRRLLADELGIEPSPLLAAQHADLLRGSDLASSAGDGHWSPTPRLPVPATSLIGRDRLASELAAKAASHRLVTLVGPGGVGKTRLLVEIGRRLRAADGSPPVVMCELSTADAESAVEAVAAALSIDARPGVPLTERVAYVLADVAVVLLLDNCEHVLEPVAALVERILSTCPAVRVVATSRERLRVHAETVCTVPPLEHSGDDGAAVTLFVQRARSVAPDFDPDRTQLAVVGEIVRRLDGLPLAIELAAARLHTHDVAEVAAGLDHRFELLSSGYRTSERHGSLSAAIAWSFELLDERLQQLFVDVSSFAGPFGAHDAGAVCGVDPDAAAARLHQLVERSLVMRAPARRYVLLETLRAFGAERLAGSGRAEEVARRHAHRQVEWIESAPRRAFQPEDSAIAEIDAAIPELRVALGWFLDHDDVERAGRLVAAMRNYALLRLRPDVLAWAERVVQADPHDRSPLAPVVLVCSAEAAWMAGDVPETVARTERALQACRRAGGAVPAEVALVCGNCALFEGRLDDAVEWYRRAAALADHDRTVRLMAASTEVLALTYAADPQATVRADELVAAIGAAATPDAAYTLFCAGEAELPIDPERARARFARALQLAERTNASFVVGLAGASIASIEARWGDPHVAARDYRRLISHWRRAGMWSTQWTMLRSIAGLLARLDRARDAAVLVGAVRATPSGHRIFGSDEVALTALSERLRAALGEAAYAQAYSDGAALDGDAAVEYALRAL